MQYLRKPIKKFPHGIYLSGDRLLRELFRRVFLHNKDKGNGPPATGKKDGGDFHYERQFFDRLTPKATEEISSRRTISHPSNVFQRSHFSSGTICKTVYCADKKRKERLTEPGSQKKAGEEASTKGSP